MGVSKSFSQRLGITEPPEAVIVDGISDELRTRIWNLAYSVYERWGHSYRTGDFGGQAKVAYWTLWTKPLAGRLWNIPLDEVPTFHHEHRHWIKTMYSRGLEWWKPYEFLEFLVSNHVSICRTGKPPVWIAHSMTTAEVVEKANSILELGRSGYRFLGTVLTPIANALELAAVEQAIEAATNAGLRGAAVHIARAAEILGQKPRPDYKNSIKESILAVEAASKMISGSNGRGLKEPLRKISKKYSIPPALELAFLNLYGWSSGENGIRHAMLESEHEPGLSEAAYMLVSCSAFVHYLTSKSASLCLVSDGDDPSK